MSQVEVDNDTQFIYDGSIEMYGSTKEQYVWCKNPSDVER